MVLSDGTKKGCVLKKVLYVPKLAYNLVSVSKAADAGKTVQFDGSMCVFRNNDGEIIAVGTRKGSLYCLNTMGKSNESVNMAQQRNEKRLWHRRLGHLNEQSMKMLVNKDLVTQLDFDMSGKLECVMPALVESSAK